MTRLTGRSGDGGSARRGIAAVALLGSAMLLLGTGMVLVFSNGRPSRSHSTPSMKPWATSVMERPALAERTTSALRDAGISPDALAAVGIDAALTALILSDAHVYLGEHGAALSAARVEYSTAKREVTQLEQLVRSGQATEGQAQTLDVAHARLASADQTLGSERSALWSAALARANADQKQLIHQVQSNRRWGLPVQYLTGEHTEAEWVALHQAVVDIRIAARRGEAPPEGATAVVAQEDALANVAAALTSWTANHEGVTTAWRTGGQ